MVGSARRQVWFMIMVAATSHATFPLAAERAVGEQRTRISFDRTCKRLAHDEMGAVSGGGHDRIKTTAPRASLEFPLQQPAHPPEASDKQGTVVLEIFVTEAGLVSEVHLSQSSGSRELDLAAMKITEHWRLRPGTVNGEPVCMWGRYAVVFRREGHESSPTMQ